MSRKKQIENIRKLEKYNFDREMHERNGDILLGIFLGILVSFGMEAGYDLLLQGNFWAKIIVFILTVIVVAWLIYRSHVRAQKLVKRHKELFGEDGYFKN